MKFQIDLELQPHQGVYIHWKKTSRAKADIKIWIGEINFDHEHEFPISKKEFNDLHKILRENKTDVFKVRKKFNRYLFYTIRGTSDHYYLTEIKHERL